MKREIENGITILFTGDAEGGYKNKFGHVGLSYAKHARKYKAEVMYKLKKYHLAYSDTIEEAIAVRQEADRRIEDGTFEEWHKNSKAEWHEKRRK